jgi:hypothetical protein
VEIPEGIDVANAQLPATYDAAKTAIATCESVDECKKWADKAAALAAYARMAEDDTLHVLATRIRGRAVRRAGELLQQFQTGPKGGRPAENRAAAGPVSQAEAGERAGLSPRQIKDSVRVSNVPKEKFEAALTRENPATVSELAGMGTKSAPTPHVEPERPRGFAEATQFLGKLEELAEYCSEHEPELIAGGLRPREIANVRQHFTVVADYYNRLITAASKVA